MLHDLLESVDFRVTAKEVLDYELSLVRDCVGLFSQVATPFDAHQVFLHRFCSSPAQVGPANEFVSTLVVHAAISKPLLARLEETALVTLFTYFEVANCAGQLGNFVTQFLALCGDRKPDILSDFKASRKAMLSNVRALTKDAKLKEKIRLLEMIDYPANFLTSPVQQVQSGRDLAEGVPDPSVPAPGQPNSDEDGQPQAPAAATGGEDAAQASGQAQS